MSMRCDESLDARIRGVRSDRDDFIDQKMFVGLCLMLRGAASS
jgi:hypothetical protein